MRNQALEIPADVRELIENDREGVPVFLPGGENAVSATRRSGHHAGAAEYSHLYARKLARAADMQEAISLQAEYLRIQVALASEFVRELTPKR